MARESGDVGYIESKVNEVRCKGLYSSSKKGAEQRKLSVLETAWPNDVRNDSSSSSARIGVEMANDTWTTGTSIARS